MVVTYLLWHLAVFCSIHFATGQNGIGFSRFPERLLHGGCEKECDEADEELKGINCDPTYKYCVRRPNAPIWLDLKKVFETDLSKECWARRQNPGSGASLAGTVCRQTCLLTEEYVTGRATACLSGLVCCKEMDFSPWSAFTRLITGLFDTTDTQSLG